MVLSRSEAIVVANVEYPIYAKAYLPLLHRGTIPGHVFRLKINEVVAGGITPGAEVLFFQNDIKNRSNSYPQIARIVDRELGENIDILLFLRKMSDEEIDTINRNIPEDYESIPEDMEVWTLTTETFSSHWRSMSYLDSNQIEERVGKIAEERGWADPERRKASIMSRYQMRLIEQLQEGVGVEPKRRAILNYIHLLAKAHGLVLEQKVSADREDLERMDRFQREVVEKAIEQKTDPKSAMLDRRNLRDRFILVDGSVYPSLYRTTDYRLEKELMTLLGHLRGVDICLERLAIGHAMSAEDINRLTQTEELRQEFDAIWNAIRTISPEEVLEKWTALIPKYSWSTCDRTGIYNVFPAKNSRLRAEVGDLRIETESIKQIFSDDLLGLAEYDIAVFFDEEIEKAFDREIRLQIGDGAIVVMTIGLTHQKIACYNTPYYKILSRCFSFDLQC